MTLRVQQTSTDCGIPVEPLAGEVVALRGDQILVRSVNTKMMHETRLPACAILTGR